MTSLGSARTRHAGPRTPGPTGNRLTKRLDPVGRSVLADQGDLDSARTLHQRTLTSTRNSAIRRGGRVLRCLLRWLAGLGVSVRRSVGAVRAPGGIGGESGTLGLDSRRGGVGAYQPCQLKAQPGQGAWAAGRGRRRGREALEQLPKWRGPPRL